jgi:hypothetical protein
MVEAYWNVGRMIVEEEQQGKKRAKYGAFLIRDLSFRLTEEFGKGFDERELRRMRQFYQLFPIRGAVRPELSWTHYRLLIRIEKQDARAWYLNEAADQNWSTRALERQIDSLYHERLLMSRDKAPVIEEMREKTAALAPAPQDIITEKDHTVAKYSVLSESRQLFASKYRLYLPTEEELRAEIEREREMVVREQQVRYGEGEVSGWKLKQGT